MISGHYSLGENLVQAFRCPKYYPFDWSLVADPGELTALLECKIRRRRFGSAYMVSLHKVAEMRAYAATAQCDPILGVYWELEDEVGIVNLLHCNMSSGIGGRRDRGDSQDREPVIFIPYREFTPVKKSMVLI